MKFCSQCGHPVIFKHVPDDNRARYVCENCHTIHYQNPSIVAGCLPVWEDRVLLCRRAIAPREGLWNIPAGYLENGESVEEGAIREVEEEAGTKVKIRSLHTVFSIPHVNLVYMHYLADLPDLNFSPGVESLECQLFAEHEIPWDEMAFNSSVFSLQKFYSDLHNGQRQVHTGVYRR